MEALGFQTRRMGIVSLFIEGIPIRFNKISTINKKPKDKISAGLV
jgi:hypothetical protein